jgi:hypothetical protein
MMQCEDCGIETNNKHRCPHCGKLVCAACFAEAHESVLPIDLPEEKWELEP